MIHPARTQPQARDNSMSGPLRTLFLVAPLLFAGCLASLGELRAMPPMRQLQTSDRYDVMAGCVVDGLKKGPTNIWLEDIGNLWLQVVRRDEIQMMTVTAYVVAAQGRPQFDLAFRQDGDTVLIEERYDDAPLPRRTSASAWNVVEHCAGRN